MTGKRLEHGDVNQEQLDMTWILLHQPGVEPGGKHRQTKNNSEHNNNNIIDVLN